MCLSRTVFEPRLVAAIEFGRPELWRFAVGEGVIGLKALLDLIDDCDSVAGRQFQDGGEYFFFCSWVKFNIVRIAQAR